MEQSEEELKKLLGDQINFMKLSCRSYDEGFKGEARRLAVSIRVLLHDTRASTSLLLLLHDKLKIKYMDTAHIINPHNLLSHCGFLSIRVSSSGVEYVPFLNDVPGGKIKYVKFEDWWSKYIFKDQKGEKFSRKDIILALANQDGGAHVDPNLNDRYAELTRRNSLGFYTSINGEDIAITGAELAASRQITHELLRSLEKYYNFQ